MPNYSGMWTLQAQMQAVSQGTWQLPPSNLYAWGSNSEGQLGQNDTVARSSPVQVGEGAVWLKLAPSTGPNSAVIKTDGTFWNWGFNGFGQLGQNNLIYRSSPVQVGLLNTYANVTAGTGFIAVTKTDGTLWVCGRNDFGQLGQNNKTYRSSPVQVGALTTWNSIGASFGAMAAIKTDGTLWTWGRNTNGDLGLGTSGLAYARSSPTQVGSLTNWSKIDGSSYGSFVAVKTDGTLWTWGSNPYGELGQNNKVYRSSPVQVGALTTWLNASIGNYQVVASKTDGTLWAWGRNNNGQLGQNDIIDRSSPVQVGVLTTWNKLSAGSQFSAAIKADGTLWVWGKNNQGQLGQNNTVYASSPVQVGSNTNWANVSCLEASMLATTS